MAKCASVVVTLIFLTNHYTYVTVSGQYDFAQVNRGRSLKVLFRRDYLADCLLGIPITNKFNLLISLLLQIFRHNDVLLAILI